MGKSVITVVICFVLISSFINAIPQTEAICIYAECNFIFNVNNESLDIDVSPGGDNELNILCLEKCDFLKNDMISKLDISIQATSEQKY